MPAMPARTAYRACSWRSRPTWGPTNSRRRISREPPAALARAACTCFARSSGFSATWGGRACGDARDPPRAHVGGVEAEAGEEHGRERAGEETDGEGDRESLHGAGAELIQDRRGDEHGHVGVDDRAEGAGEARVDGRSHGLAAAQLFADALGDADTRVHGHADGEHDARDAREGPGRVEARHGR